MGGGAFRNTIHPDLCLGGVRDCCQSLIWDKTESIRKYPQSYFRLGSIFECPQSHLRLGSGYSQTPSSFKTEMRLEPFTETGGCLQMPSSLPRDSGEVTETEGICKHPLPTLAFAICCHSKTCMQMTQIA